jgi:hypothetical protein
MLVKGFERLKQHQGKILKALVKAAIREIPGLNYFLEIYEEVYQGVESDAVEKKWKSQEIFNEELNKNLKCF